MSNDKLNDAGKTLLKARCNLLKSKNEFAIIFMGDTHDDNSDPYKQKYYKALLKLAIQDNVLCIIHGGDGGDKGIKTNLQDFVNTTKSVLKNSGIPLFLTIGNHDYDKNMKTTNNFNELISSSTIETLTLENFNTKIVQLDTDASYPGHLTSQSVKLLNKIASDKTGTHYIIDMHTPPLIGKFSKRPKYCLNEKDTKVFLKCLDTGKNHIDSVFVHHQHFYWIEHYCVKGKVKKHIPIIMLGCAGFKKNKKQNHFIKITINKNTHKITAIKKYYLPHGIKDIMTDLNKTKCASIP